MEATERDLAAKYSDMSDQELADILVDREQLTEMARGLLRDEVGLRRGVIEPLAKETYRERLEAHYNAMSDDDVVLLLRTEPVLTETERDVVEAQIRRRDLDPATLPGATVVPDGHEVRGPDAPMVGAVTGPLVTVRQFRDVVQADLAKTVLDSAGIASFLADQNIARIDWLWSDAVGGIRLQVRPQDADAANAVLAAAEEGVAAELDKLPGEWN